MLFGVVALGAACRQQDVRTVVIDVPGMQNQACVERVKAGLGRSMGVFHDQTRFDVATRTVTVTYDSLPVSLKNIEFNIAEAGFQANDIPADAAARKALPPECL